MTIPLRAATIGDQPVPKSSQFDVKLLRKELRPFRLHYFPRLRSTNDHAANLRRRGKLFAPAVVVTGKQTAGRGRGSNTWWSREGCLTITFVLPIEETLLPHQLPLIAGLAVRNACAELCKTDKVVLKWPNDVMHEGRKLAGLLCERVHKADLIGIGLNVNVDPAKAPLSLREVVTSLEHITGNSFDMNTVLITVARHLHSVLLRRSGHPFAALLREYESHHALSGKRVRILVHPDEPQLSGRCEGIDQMGRLLVRDHTQLHRVIAGQVLM